MNHMIVHRETVLKSNRSNDNNNRHNKGDIINVTKAVARKSILMQIIKARAASGFPDKDTGLPHQCQ
jgi:hypothetical protein